MLSSGHAFYRGSCERLRCQIRFRSWLISPRVQKLNCKVNKEIHSLMPSIHCTGNGTFHALRITNGLKFILKGKINLQGHSVQVQSFIGYSLLVPPDFYYLKKASSSVKFSHKVIQIAKHSMHFQRLMKKIILILLAVEGDTRRHTSHSLWFDFHQINHGVLISTTSNAILSKQSWRTQMLKSTISET